MNVLIDMNMPTTWEDFLTGAGHTAVEWADVGQPTATDRDVLVWAAERGYVLLTADFDAAGSGPRPGMIALACGNLSPDTQGHSVLQAIHQRGADLLAGASVVLGTR